jgi:hypothetical protein
MTRIKQSKLKSAIEATAESADKWRVQKRWNNTHREARRAHALVSKALREGTLKRGQCEQCGSFRVEAHHDDYSQPLIVRWLCRGDHQRHHAAMRKGGKMMVGVTPFDPEVRI